MKILTRKVSISIAALVVVALAAGSMSGNSKWARTLHQSLFHHSWHAAPTVKLAFQLAPKMYAQYTVVLQERWYDNDNNVIARKSNRTSAQKMDGTRVEQYEALKPLGSVRRREVVWPDGNPVTIYVEMGLKTTTPVVRGALFNWASRFSPESDCSSRNETFVVDHQKNAVHKVMGHETLGGVDAVKLSTPTGDILWLAPSLDCVPLGMYASSDGPAARSIRLDLVSVTTGPPDPALFAIDSFKEVAPSELNIAAERYGANLVPSFTPAGIEEMVQKMRADKQWEALDAAWRARWVH